MINIKLYVLEDDTFFNGRCAGECVPLSITSTVTLLVEFMGGSSECEIVDDMSSYFAKSDFKSRIALF